MAAGGRTGCEPGGEHGAQLESCWHVPGVGWWWLAAGGSAGGKEKWLDPGFASETELPPFLTDVGHDGEQAKMAYMVSAWQLQRRKIAMNCIGGKAQMEQIFGRWCGDGNQSRYETCSM